MSVRFLGEIFVSRTGSAERAWEEPDRLRAVIFKAGAKLRGVGREAAGGQALFGSVLLKIYKVKKRARALRFLKAP